MKQEKIYFILLSLAYAMIFLLGNWGDLSAEGLWRTQAGPWLGEPPADLNFTTVRAETEDGFPRIVFTLPANEELRQKIIATYAMQEVQGVSGRYANNQVKPLYPEENTPALTAERSCLSPWLEVKADGSMRFCADDVNVSFDEQKSVPVAPPYPQYLPQGQWELCYRELMLAVLCFMFPAVFCCVGWLWVQRHSLSAPGTKRICLQLVAVVAFVGAVVDFYWHGFDTTYTLWSAVVASLLNLLVAGILMALTALVRAMLGKPL